MNPFQPIAVSVLQAADALGCKRTRVFELLAQGILERAPRYGREIRIYTASLTRALERPTPHARKRRAPGPEYPDPSQVHT